MLTATPGLLNGVHFFCPGLFKAQIIFVGWCKSFSLPLLGSIKIIGIKRRKREEQTLHGRIKVPASVPVSLPSTAAVSGYVFLCVCVCVNVCLCVFVCVYVCLVWTLVC